MLRKYGKIRDKLGGVIPWTPWQHLLDLLDIIAWVKGEDGILRPKHQLIIILKAKQIGITWLMSGDNLHLASFLVGANILTLSKGEDEATESLDYSRFIHTNLPDFLRLPIGKDQSSLISFPTMESKLRALPSTRDAGVGFGGASRVVMDEFEYHVYARENYSELKPMIDAGGQMIILSTADKTRLDTRFKEIYRGAMSGSNGFFKVFIPYNVLPFRTQEWYDNLKKDYASWEIECRYPRNENEALETLHTRKFFSIDALEILRQNIRKPIKHELSDKYKGLVRIYKLPVVGQKYLAFCDPSDGKEDPHVTVITNMSGEEQACSFGMTPADMCAQIYDELVRLYNNAFNGFELNARAGGIFSMKIAELDTPNVAESITANGELEKKHKKGWWSSKPLWNKIIWNFEEAVRTLQITVYTKEALDEFNNFIVPEGEDPQKARGAHDDFIDAWARVWFLRRYVKSGNVAKAFSFKYSES